MKTTMVLVGAAAAGAAYLWWRRGSDPDADRLDALRRCEDAARRLEDRVARQLFVLRGTDRDLAA